MPTLEEVQDQLKKLDGVSKFFGKREIKELPSILWEDENLEYLIQGTYCNHMGVLVATNKRLIFIDKGLVARLVVEDFPYDKISSIQYQLGLVMGTVTIFTSGNKAEISHVAKDQAKAFGDYVRARITSIKNHASLSNQAEKSSAVDPIVEALERLARLKDQGILTEEEFLAQKTRILAG